MNRTLFPLRGECVVAKNGRGSLWTAAAFYEEFNMKRSQLYLSTIAADAAFLARSHQLGLEIAEFCTAANMDQQFEHCDQQVQQEVQGISRRILHAPFNELFPCAIDPLARDLARHRYRQAMQLARRYDARQLVIHGGYHPRIYYPVWYVEQSAVFWSDFMKEVPEDLTICLENVLEEDASMLLDIVSAVNHPRLRLCLDVGHVNTYSPQPVMDWLRLWAPYLKHFHLHNNDGSWDYHQALNQGSIDMKELLTLADTLCPDASYTLEVTEAGSSLHWLWEESIWKND